MKRKKPKTVSYRKFRELNKAAAKLLWEREELLSEIGCLNELLQLPNRGRWPHDLLEDHHMSDCRACELIKELKEDWITKALRMLYRYPKNVEVTGEELREWLSRNGLANPTHHNAWGALIRSAYQEGILVSTGRVRKMKRPQSHARQNNVWRTR